jgi:hypothetical protein
VSVNTSITVPQGAGEAGRIEIRDNDEDDNEESDDNDSDDNASDDNSSDDNDQGSDDNDDPFFVNPQSNPIAICRDGTLSFAPTRPEACVNNGGVQVFLR